MTLIGYTDMYLVVIMLCNLYHIHVLHFITRYFVKTYTVQILCKDFKSDLKEVYIFLNFRVLEKLFRSPQSPFSYSPSVPSLISLTRPSLKHVYLGI